MKFLGKSALFLSLLAVALGAVFYNVLSAKSSFAGTEVSTSRTQETEHRAVADVVDQVVVDVPFNLTIQPAAHAGIDLQGEPRLLAKIVTEVVDRTLYIKTKGMLLTMNQPVKLSLNLPALRDLKQTGSGNVNINSFAGAEMNVQLKGSGNMDISGQYQTMKAVLAGSGVMTLDSGNSALVDLSLKGSGDLNAIGKTKEARINLSGSGSVDAQRLIAQQAIGELHGSGDMRLYASQQVTASLHGSGDMNVFGNPALKMIENKGSGSVNLN